MEKLYPILHGLMALLNFFSIAVLVWGVLLAMWAFVKSEFSKGQQELKASRNNRIKNQLASYVLLSLEILIAADIIESIVNPSLTDIARLGAVVVIRTVLSYFLSREISEQAEKDRAEM